MCLRRMCMMLLCGVGANCCVRQLCSSCILSNRQHYFSVACASGDSCEGRVAMNQCLRCSKPCEATAVFCETCRSFLRGQLWQAANTWPVAPIVTPFSVAVLPGSDEES